VRELDFRNRGGSSVSPLGLQGRIDLFADAYDLPVPFPGFDLTLPVAPALIRWRVTRPWGAVVLPWRTAVDFRGLEPGNGSFWRIYGRGTYPNGPVFGGQLYKRMPGRYVFRLTPTGLDTRRLPNGTYVLAVAASDIRGNSAGRSERFTVMN
jgi:hypothetical protein